MKRLAVLLILGLLCAAGCIRVRLPQAGIKTAAAPQDVSWRQAVELALRHHPDILQGRSQVLSKAHGRNAAFGAYLPSVDGSFSRRRLRSTNTSPTSDSIAFDLDVTQPLFTGFGTTAEFLSAKRDWEAARWAYRETSAEVRLRLRSAYVAVLRQQQLVEVQRRIAARRQENADLIQLRYDAGREHRGSLLRAQAIADEAAFELRQNERQLESQRLAFGRELGGRLWFEARLPDDLERIVPALPQPLADYSVLAEQTPTVQRLVKTAESAKADILAAQSELWPEVNGTLNYGYSGTDMSNLRDDASAALTVSLPLFAGGQNVQGVLGSREDYRAAVEAARSARDDRISDLSTAWTAFRDAREFVEVRRKFLEASRERAEIIKSQYTSGLADFQDFDIAEQELADSEKAYVASLSDVLTREASWESVKGSTLEDVLDAG